MNGYADDRKSRRRMTNFYVSLRGLAFGGGDADFAQNFSSLERRGQHFNEEISGFDNAVALGAGGDKLCVEREDGRGPVSRGIRMRQASADSAFVAYLHVAKMAGCFRQQRAGAAQKFGDFNLEVRCHGADANLSALFL